MDNNRIVVVCGPTATGKTDLAIALCRAYNGVMVGADSMQIYEGLPIGTAALRSDEAADVKRHLIGFLPPSATYSVADYLSEARRVIKTIHAQRRLPVICGGTGLYIQSLVEGVQFHKERPGGERERLEASWRSDGGKELLARLHRKDPAHAETLSANDKGRVLRSLELYNKTGKTYQQRAEESRPDEPPYEVLLLGLNFNERSALYDSINTRADKMVQQGLLEEAERVYNNQQTYGGVLQAIGFKEFFPYFAGEAPLESCVDKLKQATRNYAKRQLTWFNKMQRIKWLEAKAPQTLPAANQQMQAFGFEEPF